MLTFRFVRGSPDFFNTEDVRKFYSLFSSIITIMDTIYARWAAHVTVFFTIVIAGVDLTKLFESQKGFGVIPKIRGTRGLL